MVSSVVDIYDCTTEKAAIPNLTRLWNRFKECYCSSDFDGLSRERAHFQAYNNCRPHFLGLY